MAVEPAEVTEDGEFVDTPATKRQAVKELHEKRSKERADAINAMKIEYKKLKDMPAVIDFLKKMKSLCAYHTKIAKDGVGYRSTGQKDDHGNPIEELIYHTNEKRISELDKAAGIQEAIDMLERQLATVEPE